MELHEERVEFEGQDVISLRGEGLIEQRSTGDGAAVSSDEVGVFVIMDDGALVEAGDYLLGPVQKAQPVATSQQLDEPAMHPKWASPRLPMTDLLLFYDFNVWHRRCVLLKAMLVTGLGFKTSRAAARVVAGGFDSYVHKCNCVDFAEAPQCT